MGSFAEVVLGFQFRPETPDEVLAAFSKLAVPRPDVPWAPPAPALPAPVDVDRDVDHWEPTNELADPAADPHPWRHDWAGWFSSSMTVGIEPSAQMVWSATGHWTVTCRWGIKSWAEAIVPALRLLGEYLQTFELRPILLGYIQDGHAARPVLLWLTPQGTIEAEDLNGPDDILY